LYRSQIQLLYTCIHTGKPTTDGSPQQTASYTMVTDKNLHNAFCN